MLKEKNKVISHILIFIPKFNEIPFELVNQWADKYYHKARYTSYQRKEAIHTIKDFKEKIAQPTIDTMKQFINPNFINRSGKEYDAIIRELEEKMLDNRTAHKYRDELKYAHKRINGIPAKKIKDILGIGSINYALKMTFGAWRFIGSIDGKGKGAVILAGEWLSGNQSTIQLLKNNDKIVLGSPILITDTKRQGQLRRLLRNQLIRSGQNISNEHYSPQIIKKENDIVNQLVQGFAKDEFEPFFTCGDSHIDFVLEPQSVTPGDSRQVKEIEYKIYSFFKGEEEATKLREKWIEKDYHHPINIQEYIGNPDKPAYFDMHLDIQVSMK